MFHNDMNDGQDVHQNLMDAAYKRWNDAADLGGRFYPDFVAGLNETQRHAVVLGKLNQQVTNGGWMQWYDNGYSECVDETIEALEEMARAGYPLATTVLDVVLSLKTAIEEIEEIDPDDFDLYGSHYEGSGDEDEDEENGYDPTDAYEAWVRDQFASNDAYFVICDDFMVQCEMWFRERTHILTDPEILNHYAPALSRVR